MLTLPTTSKSADLVRLKINPIEKDQNIKLLEDLRSWISVNLFRNIGLKELVEQSKLNSTDVMYLFERYLQTTPMTYIRKERDASK